MLQVARDSSSWIREEVPSAAPTHTSRPDSWICQLWWIGRIFNDYKGNIVDNLKTVERGVCHLDVEDGHLVVVEEVPYLHITETRIL